MLWEVKGTAGVSAERLPVSGRLELSAGSAVVSLCLCNEADPVSISTKTVLFWKRSVRTRYVSKTKSSPAPAGTPARLGRIRVPVTQRAGTAATPSRPASCSLRSKNWHLKVGIWKLSFKNWPLEIGCPVCAWSTAACAGAAGTGLAQGAPQWNQSCCFPGSNTQVWFIQVSFCKSKTINCSNSKRSFYLGLSQVSCLMGQLRCIPVWDS